jgi:hypothetical protein
MVESVTREGAEALVRKTLCSSFLAVDGTITLRWEMVPDAARAVASCLISHSFFERAVDVPSIEKLICTFVGRNGQRAVPVSVPASVVASRICAAHMSRD